MQTIQTKLLPMTETKPTRIKATHEGNVESITISRGDGKIEEDYKKAAYQLKMKLGWTEKMIGGHTDKGMMFVFFNDQYMVE